MKKKDVLRRLLIPFYKLLPEKSLKSIGILMYHRVFPADKSYVEPTLYVEPKTFAQQLEGLLSLGYTAWSLRKLLQYCNEGKNIPNRVFVVTFDDGYECVYHHAWPILKTLKIPATLFLATQYLSSREPFPFDCWEKAGSLEVSTDSWKPLTIEQCLDISSDELIELAAHSHSHQDFRDRSEDFKYDLNLCINNLKSNFGIENPMFAFPYGYTTQQLVKIARHANLGCGLTVVEELVQLKADPFTCGRFEAGQNDTAQTLAVCLSGWNDFARALLKKFN